MRNIGTHRLEPLTGCEYISKLDSEDNWISLKLEQVNEEKSLYEGVEHTHVNETGYKNVPTMPILVKGHAGIFKSTSAPTIRKLWKPY